jgi:hypothetical protein
MAQIEKFSGAQIEIFQMTQIQYLEAHQHWEVRRFSFEFLKLRATRW